MQSALRSATRRAVAGISSRRGVATTTTTKAASASASEDWLAEHEKAWVKAMVQREARARMAAEEERRITRDRLRTSAAEAEERPTTTCRRCRLGNDVRLIPLLLEYTFTAMGFAMGAGLAALLYGRG